MSKRRPPRAAAFLGTAGAHAAGTVICAYLKWAPETTPHPISKRPSPHVLDQPLCSRGYDTASLHPINLSMRSSWRQRAEGPWTGRAGSAGSVASRSRARPSRAALASAAPAPALGAMHSRGDQRLASHAPGSVTGTRARWPRLTRPHHSQRPVHTNVGSLKPHKRSHTAARTGASTPGPLALSCAVPLRDAAGSTSCGRSGQDHRRARALSTSSVLREQYRDGPFASLTYSRTCLHVTTGVSVGGLAHPPCAERRVGTCHRMRLPVPGNA